MNTIKQFRTQFFLALLFISMSGFSQNTVCFEIEANPNTDAAFSGFTKYINVFGIGIYAEDGVSDEKVKHVAAVFAEWLDNDEDSVVDNSLVLAELLSRETLMPVFAYEGSPAENTFFDNYNGSGIAAACYNNEIITTRPLVDEFDASVEEILHAISSLGYAHAYPSSFSEEENSNSLLTQAMDAARGGHFVDIPSPYPSSAWYHYDDNTCEYNCMATEYFYWGLTSKLGIQDFANRCNEIANEWEACTSNQFETTDELLYNLFSDATYSLPTNAPDGNYCPTTSNINKLSNDRIKIYPNPVENILTIDLENYYSGITTYNIIDITGKVIKKGIIMSSIQDINTNDISQGIYLLNIKGQKPIKFIVENK